MLSVTPSGRFHPRADDWIRTRINRFTRAEPFSVEPRRLVKHEREESGHRPIGWSPSASFGGWLLSQESRAY